MKIKSFLTILGLAIAMTAFTACGGSHQHDHGSHQDKPSEESQTMPHGEGAEYTSAYICPMHCEGSGSDQPGKCPVCGMDYVSQADHAKEGHTH